MQIIHPSGLITEQRKVQGTEIETLAQATERRGELGAGVAKILDACWEGTIDPGPYKFGSGRPNWKQVAVGDAITALVRHRTAIRGRLFNFPVRCRQCGERNDIDAPLDELQMQPFSAAALERVRESRPLEGQLMDGTKVTYTMHTIETDEYIFAQHKQMKKRPEWAGHKGTFVDVVAARLRTIDGMENAAGQFVKRLEFLRKRGADEAYYLKEQMDASDCGIDTGIEWRCDECGWLHEDKDEADFPLGAAFFNPRSTKEVKREAMMKEALAKEEAEKMAETRTTTAPTVPTSPEPSTS